MKFNKKLALAVSGAVLAMAGNIALADSTSDIVNVLVDKGVLTPEEGKLISKNRTEEKKKDDKARARVSIADFVDNVTFYGDVRVRYEDRSGDGIAGTTSVTASVSSIGSAGTAASYSVAVYPTISVAAVTGSSSVAGVTAGISYSKSVASVGTRASAAAITATNYITATERRERARYKLTFGAKTTSGDFYSDVAFAMGATGRSDNATFGSFDNNLNNKQALYVKRAMVGYKATDWLSIDAGRFENPLYTTPMVWDADLTWEGLAQKVKFKPMENLEVFVTAAEMQYLGDKKSFFVGAGTSSTTNELLALQVGGKYNFNTKSSAKLGVTGYYYTHGHQGMTGTKGFTPGRGQNVDITDAGLSNFAGSALVNDLDVIEVPFEVNALAMENVGLRLFGDYAINTSADDRARNSQLAGVTGSSGSDDSAWMLGVAVGSAKDLKSFEGNKMLAGDWSARLWYQEVGVWSIDQNAVDSDIFDSRVNLKGTAFKAQYNPRDNVMLNFAYAHATPKNSNYGTPTGTGNDIGLNLTSFDLYQLDLTYKF